MIARLGTARDRVVSKPFADEEFPFRFDFRNNGGVLANIGLAQLALGDLEGASKTAVALPMEDECLNCGDAYRDFHVGLAASLARSGRVNAGFDVFGLHRNRAVGRPPYSSGEVLPMAVAQANAGDAEGAKQTCRLAIAAVRGDAFDVAAEFIEVARVQVRIGDMAGARETRRLIEATAAKVDAKGQEGGLMSARLAVFYAEIGDERASRRILEQGRLALDKDTYSAGNALSHIAVAHAKLGDIVGAINVVRSISDKDISDRHLAYVNIALIQWIRGDLTGAESTVMLVDPGGSHIFRDLVLIEIVKAHAQKRDIAKATATAVRIKNDLRRAKAILETAASIALHGDQVSARKMAKDLDYPRVKPLNPFDRRIAKQFDFDDPKTWGLDFQQRNAITQAGRNLGREMESDFLAAVVRCRVLLNGPDSIAHIKEMDDWNVRKAAEAQAGAGDVAGALKWSAQLSDLRRITALIGAAEGLAEYRHEANRKPAPPSLSRRHMLVRRLHPQYLDD